MIKVKVGMKWGSHSPGVGFQTMKSCRCRYLGRITQYLGRMTRKCIAELDRCSLLQSTSHIRPRRRQSLGLWSRCSVLWREERGDICSCQQRGRQWEHAGGGFGGCLRFHLFLWPGDICHRVTHDVRCVNYFAFEIYRLNGLKWGTKWETKMGD